jgi:hypothetical protein
LRAQWTIWDFGRRSAKYGQALVTQEIAGLQYVRRQQTVAFDVARAYFEALSGVAPFRGGGYQGTPPKYSPFVRSFNSTRPELAANAIRWPRRLQRTPPLPDQM